MVTAVRKQNLGDLLSEREILVSELSEQLRVSVESIQTWTSGKAQPRPKHFQRLCAILQISPDEIDLEPADYSKDREFRLAAAARMREYWKDRKEAEARADEPGSS